MVFYRHPWQPVCKTTVIKNQIPGIFMIKCPETEIRQQDEY
jgi:hypothetical protein